MEFLKVYSAPKRLVGCPPTLKNLEPSKKIKKPNTGESIVKKPSSSKIRVKLKLFLLSNLVFNEGLLDMFYLNYILLKNTTTIQSQPVDEKISNVIFWSIFFILIVTFSMLCYFYNFQSNHVVKSVNNVAESFIKPETSSASKNLNEISTSLPVDLSHVKPVNSKPLVS